MISDKSIRNIGKKDFITKKRLTLNIKFMKKRDNIETIYKQLLQ